MKRMINRKYPGPGILALCLAVMMILSVTVYAAFPDCEDHWASEAVEYWSSPDGSGREQILTGYPDGNFRPDKSITRAEAAVIMARLLGLQAEERLPSFYDVPMDHWAYSAVEACRSFGLITGFEGKFRPEDRITRQEAVTILMRACDLPEDSGSETALDSVSDKDDIAAWARESFSVLLGQDVLSGFPDGTLKPFGPTSRAEFSTMMMKIDRIGLWQDFTFPVKQLEITSQGTGDIIFHPQIVDRVPYIFLPSSADLTCLTARLPGIPAEKEEKAPEEVPEETPQETPQDAAEMPAEKVPQEAAESVITFKGSISETSETVFDITALSERSSEGWYEAEVTAQSGDASFTSVLRIMKSEGIPSMFLTSKENSGGRYYVELKKGNSVKGSMIMLDEEGNERYNGALSQIKSRGNSTFTYLKKPYQIKLDKKSDLLGNGEKVKTWVLLSNYADPSLMRDKICKDIAREMGLPGSPECTWIDLYFDGEYRGCYLLTEKVQIGSTGLDITDLESMYEDVNPDYGDDVVTAESKNSYGDRIGYVENVTDPEDFSKGYLLEMSNNEADENSWFATTRGWALNIKAPENLSEAAVTYISEKWHEFEDAVYAKDGNDVHTGINPDTGKAFYEYCDLDSLCRMYLIYYFSNNQDAYALSTYYYLDGDSFTAGPVWDGDQTFGIGWVAPSPSDSDMRMHYIIEGLYELEPFRTRVKEIYEAEFRTIAEKFARETVPSYTNRLMGTEAMNRVLWPVYFKASGLFEAYPEDTTYADTTHDMAQWMAKRLEHMDSRFSGWIRKEGSELQARFPEYYGLETFKGLEVYMWEENGGYLCGVLPGTNRNKTDEEIIGLTRNGATVDQMKEILASYGLGKDTVNWVVIVPIKISGTSYEVLEQDFASARELFWGN